MTASDEDAFRDYVGARMPGWRRTAYLMCRDWHLADDLVGTVLGKLYGRWRRRSEINDVDAYVNGMLARAVIDETRRPWRREHPVDEFPPDGAVDAADAGSVDRLTLDSYLARLGPRRRAVLVLRFYCDLSVEETADVLGVSLGTVKSQTARGLETLRALSLTPTPNRQVLP
ncbi:RNA polymerase sigma-70 factor, sigma-E family [Asanoa hainanensis]|uniref:RNA polymerase sigma-70 factor, sigma-E family n=1 Tax=Asanoa hainanensis TaxID=560556 RepID=A0A239MQR1_9ACTN|nr:SigE family RNA polymerase sigma factor [Asanoa hainanensis]SNT44179.1 RNA polymerase sigma-70 factor, sigma-E family [Asanoa hainanensis]